MDSIFLTDRTRNLLRARPRSMTYQVIHKATGLELPWLRSFGACEQEDSACRRVQTLWEYLTGKKLDLEYPISPDHYS